MDDGTGRTNNPAKFKERIVRAGWAEAAAHIGSTVDPEEASWLSFGQTGDEEWTWRSPRQPTRAPWA